MKIIDVPPLVSGERLNESINVNCLAEHLAHCKQVTNCNYISYSYSYCCCSIMLERGGPSDHDLTQVPGKALSTMRGT